MRENYFLKVRNIFVSDEPFSVENGLLTPTQKVKRVAIKNKYKDIIFCFGWKWIRHPSIKRVLAYETISETDFGLIPIHGYRPNYFVNIEAQLDSKLAAMDIDNSELGDFPFPRSHKAIRALATIRGATFGFKAVKAFELLRERL
jgi:hypothetical protein